MKIDILKRIIPILLMTIIFGVGYETVQAQNSINGIIFNENRKPVANIDVELLDDLERLVQTTKTNGGGLYLFQGLRAGVYYVKIRVDGTNFLDAKERIILGDMNRTVQTSSGTRTTGSDSKQQNFYLQVNPKRLGVSNNPSVTGVIFAQEVPETAESAYKSGLKNLNNKKDNLAKADFEKAIQIFPDYFLALYELGNIYLNTQKFAEAEEFFGRAIAINAKSFTSFFNLATAQHNLNKKEVAIENLKKANELDGNSINAHLLLGIIQRELKQFSEAEKSLLKAKELSKNKEADVNWQLAELFYFDLKKPKEAADELDSYLKNLSKKEKENNPKKIEGVKKLIEKIRSESEKTR